MSHPYRGSAPPAYGLEKEIETPSCYRRGFGKRCAQPYAGMRVTYLAELICQFFTGTNLKGYSFSVQLPKQVLTVVKSITNFW